MNKITGVIKKHKKMAIVISVLIILFLLILLLKILLFSNSSSSVYGDRLKDKDKYEVKKSEITEIKNELFDQTAVSKVSYNNEGRILSFVVTLDTEIKNADSKKYANIITDNLKDKIKSYYDIQVVFKTEKSSDAYPIAGYKNKSSDGFVWSGDSE